MKEFEFIESLASSFGGGPEGIGDDAALFGGKYLIAKDIMAQGVHFTEKSPLNLVIRKLFTSNVSDIAAMGGKPLFALLGVAAPKGADLKTVASAAAEAAGLYGVKIVGGDTTESRGGLFLSMTIVGVKGRNLLLRSGARPGDILYLSRPVGTAKACLEKELGIKNTPAPLPGHYEKPAEKDAGIFLGSRRDVTAAADISDGLGRDAGHIASMSGVRIIIDEKALIFPELSFLGNWAASYALSSGEEFALVFTVKNRKQADFEKDFYKALGRKPLKIGFAEEGSGCFLKNNKAFIDISFCGYEHFSL